MVIAKIERKMLSIWGQVDIHVLVIFCRGGGITSCLHSFELKSPLASIHHCGVFWKKHWYITLGHILLFLMIVISKLLAGLYRLNSIVYICTHTLQFRENKVSWSPPQGSRRASQTPHTHHRWNGSIQDQLAKTSHGEQIYSKPMANKDTFDWYVIISVLFDVMHLNDK